MRSRIVLLPIDRYRVDYEVGIGTPFSQLDSVVLRAIAVDQMRTVASLAASLFLPKRLLIESIVALSRAGWVAVGSGGEEFHATELGQNALKASVLPTPERVLARQGSILMDRLTGQVASPREMTYWTTKRLMDNGLWEGARKLPRDSSFAALDAGQVKPLLQREKNEWIRWIGAPIPQQEAWLKLEVDDEACTVSNLPEAWAATLMPALASFLALPGLSRRSATLQLSPSSARRVDEEEARPHVPVLESEVELVTTGAAHLALLERAFKRARSQILIASAFVNPDVLERDVAPLVKEALARGVRVDLLWGYSAGQSHDDQQRTAHILRSLRNKNALPQALRFNERPSGSHAKLLVWDDPEGNFSACVGSNNWLSVPRAVYAESDRELSVCTTSRGIVAEVCSSIAGIWGQIEGGVAGVTDLWHRTASELDRVETQGIQSSDGHGASEHKPQLQALQVRDQDHEAVMGNLIRSAEHRVAVVSHRAGAKSLVRLAALKYAASPSVDRRVVVVVGESADADVSESLDSVVAPLNGVLVSGNKVHAKVLIADDTVLISSYNFLSADPFGTASGAREIGLLLCGKPFSDRAWDWLGQWLPTPHD